jgi:uncharacterized membrane protein
MLKKLDKNTLMKTERLLAFSDGVFAIAITLLVLEIKIPKHEDLQAVGGLYNYLFKIWPSYVSYVMSFFAIGIWWSNHHWLFTFINKTNHTFNILHLFFLMSICFLPFTSAILGDYILDEEYKNAAVTTFCVGFFIPIPWILAVYLYAVHKHRLVDDNLNQKFINNLTYKLIGGIVLVIIAITLSFNYPIVSISIIGVNLLMYLMPPETPVYDEVDEPNE